MIELIRELGVPFAGVIILVVVTIREARRGGEAQNHATIELQASVVEGLREDLVRATNEARAARVEAAESRNEAARDREARRRVEDEFYAYRMNARQWVAALLSQMNAAHMTPAEPPAGFEV